MIIHQTEHKMGVEKFGIKARAILRMPNGRVQFTCTRSADTMLEVLADELLALRGGGKQTRAVLCG